MRPALGLSGFNESLELGYVFGRPSRWVFSVLERGVELYDLPQLVFCLRGELARDASIPGNSLQAYEYVWAMSSSVPDLGQCRSGELVVLPQLFVQDHPRELVLEIDVGGGLRDAGVVKRR